MTSFSWNNAASGFWSGESNWTPFGFPGSAGGDTATINATGGSYTVTYNEPTETLNDLTVDAASATLKFNPGDTLTVSGATSLEAGTISLLATGDTLNADNLTTSLGSTINLGSGAKLNYSSANVGGLIDITNSTTLGTTKAAIKLGGTIEATGGTGTIEFAAISGSGTLEAHGAKLLVASSLADSTVTAAISDSADSVFETTGTLFFGSSVPIHFLGARGEFQYNNSVDETSIHFDITGLNAGTSKTTPTNFIGLAHEAVTITSGGTGLGTTGSVVLSNSDTLALSGITNVGTLGWIAETVSDGAGGTEIFLADVCYVGGTRILTPTGEKAVEALTQGNLVLTASDRELVPLPVKWIGHRRIDFRSHPRPKTAMPVRIRRDAFADGVPHRDLTVSPDHAILVDGKLICARQLVNGTTICQELDRTVIDYYHVELDRHAILLAEGLPAESYLDTGNRGFFANSGAPLILRPDLTDDADYPAREMNSCAPFVWDEASVRPVWLRLAERAAAIGLPVAQRPTTTDPDLLVLIDQRPIKPLLAERDRIMFILPWNTREIRLVSRAQSPTEARPWIEDRRRLGVRVNRIVLRGPDEVREIPMDHPDLTRGWWAIERDDQSIGRWTDGDALVPLPKMDGRIILEIHLAELMTYVVDAEPENETRSRAA